ncbi:MAG: sigma-70 family RNA polymerase sigma factor [Candidatus Korobacteraceae bacterium]
MSAAVEQALALIRDRRPDSIDQALALLQNTVYSFSMKVCGHPEDAEDTMQEVLLKAIPHLSNFDNPRALAVWLYKVARNRCISNRRGDRNSAQKNISLNELMPDGRELAELLSKAPGPEVTALNRETAEHLKQAVLAVPPAYRMVLVLHDMEELSTAEVAQITGLREGTVRVRLHRARLLVRRGLARLAKGKPLAGLELHAGVEGPRPQRCRPLFAALSDYMDGVVDDAVCAEMERHIQQCQPCQAFLASLKQAVLQCHSYAPPYDSRRADELRQDLLLKYQQAVAGLEKVQGQSIPG